MPKFLSWGTPLGSIPPKLCPSRGLANDISSILRLLTILPGVPWTRSPFHGDIKKKKIYQRLHTHTTALLSLTHKYKHVKKNKEWWWYSPSSGTAFMIALTLLSASSKSERINSYFCLCSWFPSQGYGEGCTSTLGVRKTHYVQTKENLVVSWY